MRLTKDDNITAAGQILVDSSQPLKKRFRALFTLKNIATASTLHWIEETLLNDDSVLLKHECAYCLGQMQLKEAVPILIPVLNNDLEDPIIRHEAGESLGNLTLLSRIGIQQTAIKALEKNVKDKCSLVWQTCELALHKIKWESESSDRTNLKCDKFTTQDPAPPMESFNNLEELENILSDSKQTLFNKYRALFSLRNMGTIECVDILGRTLVANIENRQMDLMMHEIGYIFGQLCDPDSIKYLKPIIQSKECHEIARHECVEALGSIATAEAIDFLKKFIKDESTVVRQSAEVALDMTDYFNSEDQFQFLEV